ncbi:MAG: phage baseplate assembly protein [Pseudomonadota bacterium]
MDALDKLARRLQLMIGRCVIRAVAAGGGRVLVGIDGFADQALDDLEYAEPTGLTCIPRAGAEGIAVSIMGDGSHQVVIPLGDRRHRPRDLKPGDSSLHDHRGHRIDIVDGRIRITSPDRLEIAAPEIDITATAARINGEAIATVTDEVEVGSGSSAGRWPIVTGVGDDG